jgi:hypothetical protein
LPTAQTISTAQQGSLAAAGPATTVAAGVPGGAGFGGRGAASAFGPPGGGFTGPGNGASAGARARGGFPRALGGGPGGFGRAARGGQTAIGGRVSSALVAALERDASRYRWVAATDGSNSAATLELDSGGKPVMAIGGFNNNGGLLTLAQFKRYVARREIHYYVAEVGGGGGGPFGGSGTNAITSWVESHFRAETIGGTTVYNLSR